MMLFLILSHLCYPELIPLRDLDVSSTWLLLFEVSFFNLLKAYLIFMLVFVFGNQFTYVFKMTLVFVSVSSLGPKLSFLFRIVFSTLFRCFFNTTNSFRVNVFNIIQGNFKFFLSSSFLETKHHLFFYGSSSVFYFWLFLWS